MWGEYGMDAQELIFETDGRIAYLTFNRPAVMNALTLAMLSGIRDLTARFEEDADLSVLIVSGAGGRAFSAGGDLGATLPELTESGRPSTGATQRWFVGTSKPVIAAISGICVAGGCEIMLGTDLRVASQDAVIGLTEPRWGLIPGGGGTVRLPRQIPWARAMELLLLGSTITAEEALQLGLVNRVVPTADVMSTAEELAAKILRNGPLAIRKIKEAALKCYTMPWDDAFRAEYEINKEVLSSEDAKEGPLSFVEKRRPNFTGR
jgi:enoyl-CoA hydratase